MSEVNLLDSISKIDFFLSLFQNGFLREYIEALSSIKVSLFFQKKKSKKKNREKQLSCDGFPFLFFYVPVP